MHNDATTSGTTIPTSRTAPGFPGEGPGWGWGGGGPAAGSVRVAGMGAPEAAPARATCAPSS